MQGTAGRRQELEVRSQKSKIGSGGFSLIEIIITLVVLSIAAVAVLSVFTTGIKASANPLLMNQAVQLAQSEMDQNIGEKKANTFNSANLAANAAPAACLSAASMLAGFNCSRTICFVPAANLNDTSNCTVATSYKHVTVTVTQAAIGSVNLDGLVTNY
jgi:prepilin-type N-terminal cleavage/methylation domain-containing protein